MQPEQEKIAKRAVACKGWRWLPGMRTLEMLQAPPWTLPLWDEAIVLSTYEGDPARVCTVLGKVRELHPGAVPDLTDPATLGCLVALVREAWGQDDLGAFRVGGAWCAEVTPQEGQHHAFYGSSEVEALVAALEAAGV